jgi:hypothetical protein
MKKRKEVYRKGNRKKFCAAVISNSIITDGFRIKFINELNKYKKVDMGGVYNNNIGKPHINFQLQWKTRKDKAIYQKKYLIHS